MLSTRFFFNFFLIEFQMKNGLSFAGSIVVLALWSHCALWLHSPRMKY